ncbi:MAG: hypothetical protein K2X49_10985 [Acetobacteraceae bacterium]|nr:hypothetical protein [Acetobacteraceae bacterium]
MRVLAAAALLLVPMTAEAACQAIRFPPGSFGTELRGVAPSEDVLCYTLATGEGQTARLRVLRGNNVIFAIPGITDAQDAFSFRTQRRTYEILVGQLMRAVTPQPFLLSVSVQ